MRYAQITNGVCEGLLNTPNPIDAPHMISLPDESPVNIGWTYDGTNWSEPELVPETTKWVESYRFLFRLHDMEQQILMDAVHSAALGLTPAQIVNPDPDAVDAYGYPLSVLKVFRIAYEQMDRLGGQVDLLSRDIDLFFAAAASVGIYGDTEEEQQAEIGRIKADRVPDGSGS